MSNPLTVSHTLPPFDQIQPRHVVEAIKQLTSECLESIDQLVSSNQQPDETNFLRPLENIQDRLNQSWSPVSHLANVADSPELRKGYQQALGMMSEFGTKLGQHQGLYQSYLKLDVDLLSPVQKKAVENALLSFKLSGIALDEKNRDLFSKIQMELSQLGNKFQENVLDATQGWSKHITDIEALAGLPETALSILKQAAEAKDQTGWLVTLEAPSYLAVMTYSENRELRREVAVAFVSRASDAGPNAGQWDNAPVMERIMLLRSQKAKLLGYANYAELSLAQKMAESPDQVLSFLNQLGDRSISQAKSEFEALQVFAQQELGLDTLNPWDIAWASEKLKERTFSVSQEMIRPYLPADKSIAGLFEVCQRLFKVTFQRNDQVKVYHSDVQYFDVLSNGEVIAGFYFDLYARTGKRGGAWMDDCRVRRTDSKGNIQIPVAYLNCNFAAPSAGKPSLLTHNELTTLFHEFGHGIHHMLTQIDVADVSGINGVSWDAVELPSQFMENYCWQPEALDFISGHVDTGESLPPALLDKLLAAKNFQSAMFSVRQLEFSLFDFELHCQPEAQNIDQIRNILNQVRERVAVVPIIDENRFENGFSHIFGGGYAAGYYSYKWAEVLSADAFSLFEEKGVFDPNTGQSFFNNILAKGGSQDAMDLFKAFRGREPNIDALLRHNGIQEPEDV